MTADQAALDRVRRVVARLLDPEEGCPWDKKQTPVSIGSYILEETYELLEELERGSAEGVMEELGDCLFLHCFLVHLFEASGQFSLDRVLDRAADKMIGRHPHIFGDGPHLEHPEQVKDQWDRIKRVEKKRGVLDGVPRALPSLLRTHRLTGRAGRVGFDWRDADSVFDSLLDEIQEFREELAAGRRERAEAELGDVLFTLANLGRHLNLKAEEALRGANDRFVQRFQYIERRLTDDGRTPEDADLEEMDRLWAEAKRLEE
jgi:tetrapyrrole methylase family protein/MazG family protein/ATP diphosphatase